MRIKMKKVFYVFVFAFLMCACNKESEDTNGSQQNLQSKSIVIRNGSSRTTLTYDKDGRIFQFSYAYERDGVDVEYYTDTFSFSGSDLTITSDMYGDDICELMNGNIVKLDYEVDSYHKHYEYEYESGFLTHKHIEFEDEEDSYVDDINFIWKNSCLVKIIRITDDNASDEDITLFTYGEDSNPYYGSNFDPLAIFLGKSVAYGSRSYKLVGLLGRSCKKLPISIRYYDELKCSIITASIEYKFWNGSLSEIKLTSSSGEESLYTITVI